MKWWFFLQGALAMALICLLYKVIIFAIEQTRDLKLKRARPESTQPPSRWGGKKIAIPPITQYAMVKDLEKLAERVKTLEDGFQTLQDFNQQSIEAAAIMNPTEFTTEMDDKGNTVFLKNGKEKVYETIDWRNR